MRYPGIPSAGGIQPDSPANRLVTGGCDIVAREKLNGRTARLFTLKRNVQRFGQALQQQQIEVPHHVRFEQVKILGAHEPEPRAKFLARRQVDADDGTLRKLLRRILAFENRLERQ